MALRWRRSCILTASIFPLRYDPLVARQIRASPGTLSAVDRYREARRACPQSPEQSALLFFFFFSFTSPILLGHTRYRVLDVLPQRLRLCSTKKKLRSFLHGGQATSALRWRLRDLCDTYGFVCELSSNAARQRGRRNQHATRVRSPRSCARLDRCS